MDFEGETQSILRLSGIRVNIDLPESPISFRNILVKFPILYRETELLETDGAYVRKRDKHYIYINSNQHPNRRRFSTGHEFGHYYLGHPSDTTVDIKALQDKQKERDANSFSGSLLMPRDELYKVHCARSTIKEIAAWFRVSEIATAIRLKSLGLRPEESEIVISDYRLYAGDPVYEER